MDGRELTDGFLSTTEWSRMGKFSGDYHLGEKDLSKPSG